MNNDVNEKKGKGNSKRIGITVALILLLVVSITGATYAYFAISASNSTAITGTAAQVGLQLDVTEQELKTPNGGVMVPQLATALGTAINSTNKCVDANGNIVCKVYEIKVTNNSTAAVVVNGTIAFVSATNGKPVGTNLKWRRLDSATALSATTTGSYVATGIAASTTATDLITGSACATGGAAGCQSITLNANSFETYYIVVWIDEISDNQYDVDGDRTFTGTVAFTSSNGQGVTSTITS